MARTIEDDPASYGPIVEAIARDCAANRKEIASTNRRLDHTNRLLSDLACEVGNQRRHIGIMSGDLTDMKDVVESTNLRVIRLEGGLQETNGRLTSLEGAQQETNTRLTSLEGAQQETNTRLTSLEGAQQETNTRLTSLEGAQRETNTRLNGMEATQIEHSNLLAQILGAVEKLGETKSSRSA